MWSQLRWHERVGCLNLPLPNYEMIVMWSQLRWHKNVDALQHASVELRADHEVVLAAVAQDGSALEHASKALRGNPTVVLTAVAQNGYALGLASARITS